MAMRIKASVLSFVRSYSLLRRRERLSQPKVRSTIHRRGCTEKPRCPATALITWPHHPQRTQAHVSAPWNAESAHKRCTYLTISCTDCNNRRPPSRSCVLAGRISKPQTRPSVSTARKRLRPQTFFPRIVATRPALLSSLDRLAVQHQSLGPGLLARLLSHFTPQPIMDMLPQAALLPEPEVMKDNAVRRKVMRQSTPGAAVACLIQDGVDDFSPRISGRATARLGGRNQITETTPLGFAQVGGVRRPCHDQRHNHYPMSPLPHFLDTLLESKEQATILSSMLGPQFEDFKKRLKEYR
jgi:hypothetical protein